MVSANFVSYFFFEERYNLLVLRFSVLALEVAST